MSLIAMGCDLRRGSLKSFEISISLAPKIIKYKMNALNTHELDGNPIMILIFCTEYNKYF